MHYVYILQSKYKKCLYKGASSDLKRRIKEHNLGRVVSTKFGAPWVLIYYEAFVNKTDALREERFLKSGKGRERVKLLLEKTLN